MVLLVSLSAQAFVQTQSDTATAKRPNVIVIMTDDQGNNLGYLGNPYLKTPNIDQLAAQSIRMTNFHQENKCTTSRAALMTGKDSFRTGAWRTSKGRSTMRAEEVTLAEMFQGAGYKTGHFGKWHLGEAWPTRPIDQGFAESVQLKTGGIGQIADYWNNDYIDDTYYHNGVAKPYKGYCTDVFFDEAMRYIKEVKDQPFFIYLAPNVAHVPFIVDEKYSKPFEEAGLVKKQAVFYGMIQNLDDNFGRLDAFLKEQGLSENTIIVYTTDDGASGTSFIGKGKDDHVTKGWNMNMRGGKGSRFEGGHRVFANIKYPQSGLTGDNNTLTAIKDVYPTLLDIAGISYPDGVKLDGRSFAPYLKTALDPQDDERPIYINYYNPKRWDSRKDASVIYKNWRLTSATELYDIDSDWSQVNDIAKLHPELVKKLNSGYDAWDKKAQQLVRTDIVRFVLGDKQHREIIMTGQDHWTNNGCNPFRQDSARGLVKCNGPLKVKFINSGKYSFTLSRYPLYTAIPFSTSFKERTTEPLDNYFAAQNARLKVGEQQLEKIISGDDNQVTFTMNIDKGEMDIQSWISGQLLDTKGSSNKGEHKVAPAYFVTVNYLSE